MSLLSDIEAETLAPGYQCGIARILEALDVTERNELEHAINRADKYTNAAIARALAKRGHKAEAFTVSRHRRGDCRCGK